MIGGGVSRRILEEVPFPLFLEGTLGVDVGPGSDGLLIGTQTPQAIYRALAYDAAVITNETTGANNATANDMHLWPAAPAVDDAFVFLQATPFAGLNLTIGTKGVDVVYTALWEYYKGTWETLTTLLDETSDGTHGPFSVDATGAKKVRWIPPTDWSPLTITISEGVTATGYPVRARLSAFTSITTVPLGSRVYACDLTHATGLKSPIKGTVKRATWYCSTTSGSAADTKLLLVNVTKGTSATITLTKATVVGEVTGLGLGVAIGDQLALWQVGEDGTTEFADVQLYLHFDQ